MEFADPKARVTRRLRQQIGVDCQSMPTSHAAVRHGVSWGKARRAEKAFLVEWDRTRVRRQPRHIGLDEIHRGKGQRFWTVLSDVVHGEVMGLRQDRSEATATALLTADLTGRQRAAITARRAAPATAGGRSRSYDSRVNEVGRRRWKKEAGYHRQAWVENAFFRYKSIIASGRSYVNMPRV